MRDHVTEERISAYVDGELEGDELRLVERLLAESAEHRQLATELQELRASLRALPNVRLPADFHQRVAGRIDELGVSSAREPVRPGGRESKRGGWGSVLTAVASLAAMIALTMALQPPTPAPLVPGAPSGRVTPVAMPVYMREDPNYVMVYDVTVTPIGQQKDTVDKLLAKLGIAIDPALRLDDKLEKDLLAVRESQFILGATDVVPYKNDLATPKSTDKDRVEMIYVAGVLTTLDQFGIELERLSNVGDELSGLHYDMVIEPNKLGVMHRLHHSAREHFAQSSSTVPSDVGQAFRLSLRIELTSASLPGAAIFPTPTIKVAPASSLASDAASADVNADGAITASDALGIMSQLNRKGDEASGGVAGGVDDAGQPNQRELEAGHILLIIRNVGARAD